VKLFLLKIYRINYPVEKLREKILLPDNNQIVYGDFWKNNEKHKSKIVLVEKGYR
jgi:hypothetical protein